MSILNKNIGPFTRRYQPNYVPSKNHRDRYDVYNPVNSIVDLKDKKILDFGCGFGNLLISSQGSIDPRNYTGIDVDPLNLKLAKRIFPHANWLFQNLYNPMYNPYGSDVLDIKESYDVIVSYSVFTHMSYKDFLSYTDTLTQKLNQNGTLLISIYLQDNTDIISKIKTKRSSLYGSCEELYNNQSVLYLVNNSVTENIENYKECDYLSTFYARKFIQQHGKIYQTSLPQSFLCVDKNT